jgi:NAD(P)-dependent dehydrogenase (short-subunit alcohol dehydrogenase family)
LILTQEIRDGAQPDMLKGMLARTRSTRHGEPGDVSSMVACLLPDEGSWINGQVINVDGGTVIR